MIVLLPYGENNKPFERNKHYCNKIVCGCIGCNTRDDPYYIHTLIKYTDDVLNIWAHINGRVDENKKMLLQTSETKKKICYT